jgi:hypothetical protein
MHVAGDTERLDGEGCQQQYPTDDQGQPRSQRQAIRRATVVATGGCLGHRGQYPDDPAGSTDRWRASLNEPCQTPGHG